jgi:2-dehydropantoate 2-reductase
VFGAGVVGSVYAGRLAAAGQDVALLARGARLAQLRREGLTLVDEASGEETSPRLRIVEEYLPDDIYDVVIVATRADQIAEVLPVLAANRRVSCVIFLQNCASGPANLIAALGRERVVLGFPGAGGAREDTRVQYRLIPQQKTTLGEVSGPVTPRLHRIASVLQAAGFQVALSRRMDAWLKTHAVFVTAIAGAIYLAGGTCANVSSGTDGVPRLVRAVRQGFHALRTAGVFIEPRKLAILTRNPDDPPWRLSEASFLRDRGRVWRRQAEDDQEGGWEHANDNNRLPPFEHSPGDKVWGPIVSRHEPPKPD